MEEEEIVYDKWQDSSDQEDGYLKQKAKLHWLTVGDRNNSYFHKTVNVQRVRNSIRETVYPKWEVLTHGEHIKQEAETFFKNLLTYRPLNYQGMTIEELQVVLDFRCTEAD